MCSSTAEMCVLLTIVFLAPSSFCHVVKWLPLLPHPSCLFDEKNPFSFEAPTPCGLLSSEPICTAKELHVSELFLELFGQRFKGKTPSSGVGQAANESWVADSRPACHVDALGAPPRSSSQSGMGKISTTLSHP